MFITAGTRQLILLLGHSIDTADIDAFNCELSLIVAAKDKPYKKAKQCRALIRAYFDSSLQLLDPIQNGLLKALITTLSNTLLINRLTKSPIEHNGDVIINAVCFGDVRCMGSLTVNASLLGSAQSEKHVEIHTLVHGAVIAPSVCVNGPDGLVEGSIHTRYCRVINGGVAQGSIQADTVHVDDRSHVGGSIDATYVTGKGQRPLLTHRARIHSGNTVMADQQQASLRDDAFTSA